MASKKSGWKKFPHEQKQFDYAGDKLKKAWAVLHAGDREPFPDDKRAAARNLPAICSVKAQVACRTLNPYAPVGSVEPPIIEVSHGS